jgi:hypothetical protein
VGASGRGVGLHESIPRRVLALYNRAESDRLFESVVHRLLATPLEYLGYAIDYADVSAPLPAGDLSLRYAGVVTWFGSDSIADAAGYERWLTQQLDHGLRVAVFGHLGIELSSTLAARVGLIDGQDTAIPPVTIKRTSGLVGFEAQPAALARELPIWAAREGVAHIEVVDARGRRITPVVIGSFGGLALDPYVMLSAYDRRQRWIIDPFAFLTQALALEPIPAPDPTTENGRRLLFIHIDGDGFASRAETPRHPFSGEVILNDFLRRYPLPTTVSIIEGEVGPAGLYPQLSPALETIARDIFRLPHVEVASHSFSHPFDWAASQGEETGKQQLASQYREAHLPIPGYHFSLKREVAGSVHYIDQRLTRPDKPTRTFLWSGNTQPDEDALSQVAALGLANMNGVNSETPGDELALRQIPSLGRPVGSYFQVYAGAENENVYTNQWHGPFYGFRDIVRTFRFSDSPRRLKAIDLYYHFYSGTKIAATNALDQVYRWLSKQETLPIHVSEMAARVQDFQRALLARRWDGVWEIRGLTTLRTVRLDRRLGWPDLDASEGVVGERELDQGRYVALAGLPTATLRLTTSAPSGPALAWANAPLVSWHRNGDAVTFRLRGHLPVNVSVAGCSPRAPVKITGARVQIERAQSEVRLSFASTDTGLVTLPCR